MKRKHFAVALLVAFVVFFGSVHRCSRLPSLEGRSVSFTAGDTATTRLGRAIAPLTDAHTHLSGIHPLREPRDAFAARLLLARAAERTLDVQYYIWHADRSGTLLFNALVEAADRGVRVRLLLDDNNTKGLDAILAALDSHRNIEVRLFNPHRIRAPRLLGLLVAFPRLNRRMHNKSFTADNQATVIGGRNVGDEYFGATNGVVFADLDAIAVGPVVPAVSRDFDRYWNSESAFPADKLLPKIEANEIAKLAAAARRVANDPAAVAYMTALRESPFVRELLAGTLPLEWANARMVSDPPSKVLGRANDDELLFETMQQLFGRPTKSVDLVSPYFVPAEFGVGLFERWRRDGVRVRVLTNSLDATDVTAVHAGYAKRRHALLRAGVVLYELRSIGSAPAPHAGSFGSSGSSLHAKTFAVDGAKVFIGSFNFDPRSAALNTEMGFVIDSPAMARTMTEVFEREVPRYAYEVRQTRGELRWIERRENGTTLEHTVEPHTTFLQRAGVSLLAWLPIEWLL